MLCSRRNILLGVSTAVSNAAAVSAIAKTDPPQPPVGNCADCIGLTRSATGSSLAQCRFNEDSCVSSFNDDDYSHFVPPFEYEGISREAAIAKLVAVSTSRVDYRITRPAGAPSSFLPFNEEHRVRFNGELSALDYDDGYVRVVLGGAASPVYDAEFFFPRDDNIVLVRCAARPLGKSDTPRVRLSFISGLTVSKNGAYEMLEDLRKALRWQAVPVLMGNDPKSNSDVKLPFEKLFEQYLPRAALKK